MESLTGMWMSFFTAAGVPSDVAATYAITFTENRIQSDMLLDLNKEYLRDMEITRMGDVIAILRHAKAVHEKTARQKVLNTSGAKVPVAAVAARLPTPPAKSSSPVTRMLEHYTRNPPQSESPEPPATVSVKRKITEVSGGSSNDVKKARLVEIKTTTTTQPSAGPVSKKCVFSRLGSSERIKIECPILDTESASKTIFSRLGTKSVAVNAKDGVQQPLQYEGILKSQPEAKRATVKFPSPANKEVRKPIGTGTMRADEAPISAKQKLTLNKTKQVKFSNKVDYKVIEPIPKRVSKSISADSFLRNDINPFFNNPERRLSVLSGINAPEIKSRLGTAPVAQEQRNVFNRLGTGRP